MPTSPRRLARGQEFSSAAMSKPFGGIARCPRCPPGACQRRLLPLPVSVMLIFGCFLVQVGDFYFFTALANKPPLKGVTPHGVGRCPQGRGDRSVRGGPAKLVEGFFREMQLLVQPCRNRPAEFARTSLSAWGLPTPVVALACIGNVDIQAFSYAGGRLLFFYGVGK